uniref:Uncharacterized protein n=1 Tax=Cacopsylla melanoneura TaxID=428564 RepID=A0A8D9BDN8_9HEMI
MSSIQGVTRRNVTTRTMISSRSTITGYRVPVSTSGLAARAAPSRANHFTCTRKTGSARWSNIQCRKYFAYRWNRFWCFARSTRMKSAPHSYLSYQSHLTLRVSGPQSMN